AYTFSIGQVSSSDTSHLILYFKNRDEMDWCLKMLLLHNISNNSDKFNIGYTMSTNAFGPGYKTLEVYTCRM
ncbi:MAG: hypothetical protein KBD78_13680, partial [Oligoflexales bacterium]|nr:hypothetical protein [Oligoflexales bacterium]